MSLLLKKLNVKRTGSLFILKAGSTPQPKPQSYTSRDLNKSSQINDPNINEGASVVDNEALIQQEERNILKIPLPNQRQNYRFWRVTPPSFGKTVGLTVVYEGDQGAKFYLGSGPLIKVSTLFMNNIAGTGKETYRFQQVSSSYINRSISYQKGKNPQNTPRITLKFLRVNHESKTCLLYQKIYSVITEVETGNFKLGSMLEVSGIIMSKDAFLDPYVHITDSVDNYQVNQYDEQEDDI